jgi:hypothetical protein
VTDSVHLYRVNGRRKAEQACSLLTLLDEQPIPVWQREPPKAARSCSPRAAEIVETRAATLCRVLDTLRAGIPNPNSLAEPPKGWRQAGAPISKLAELELVPESSRPRQAVAK